MPGKSVRSSPSSARKSMGTAATPSAARCRPILRLQRSSKRLYGRPLTSQTGSSAGVRARSSSPRRSSERVKSSCFPQASRTSAAIRVFEGRRERGRAPRRSRAASAAPPARKSVGRRIRASGMPSAALTMYCAPSTYGQSSPRSPSGVGSVMTFGRKSVSARSSSQRTCPWKTLIGKQVSALIEAMPAREIRSSVGGENTTRQPRPASRCAQKTPQPTPWSASGTPIVPAGTRAGAGARGSAISARPSRAATKRVARSANRSARRATPRRATS